MILMIQNHGFNDRKPRHPSSARLALRLTAAMICALFFAVTSTVASAAQSTTAVRGIVRDPLGAALAGVTVGLRQGSSGLERTVTTDANGRFEIANLPVGLYDLLFEHAGFSAE